MTEGDACGQTAAIVVLRPGEYHRGAARSWQVARWAIKSGNSFSSDALLSPQGLYL
jgi:hypothetical protein